MDNRYKQLTLKERYHIEVLSKLGFSARKIAIKIGRGNKTVSHELTRCSDNAYSAEIANKQAEHKRRFAAKLTRCTESLKQSVYDSLILGFSPEQIAGRMIFETVLGAVSCNTIYRLVKRELWCKQLARKGKPYKIRKGVEAGAKLIPGRVDISERPKEVDDKVEVGHWEADTVHGKDGYFVTLVERVSKAFLIRRVPNKSKKAVTIAMKKMLKPFKSICKTITFDNGGEFADHQKLSKYIKCDTYFAKPYHSWQRGLSENSNGLLRRYFPKGMAIGALSEKEIKQVEFLINIRPRKALNYMSPYEFLTGKRVSLIAEI
jgi:IS30 family transposase